MVIGGGCEGKCSNELGRRILMLLKNEMIHRLVFLAKLKIKLIAFEWTPWFFKNNVDWRNWQRAQVFFKQQQARIDTYIDIEQVAPIIEVSGTIAIHLHMYYADLYESIFWHLNQMPFTFDLYVSVPSETEEKIALGFKQLKKIQHCFITQVENQGRDLAPLFVTFNSQLLQYDYVAHIHTKKSPHASVIGRGWGNYLCETLFMDENRIRKIFSLLQNYGFVYPKNYQQEFMYDSLSWSGNQALAKAWGSRLGLEILLDGIFDFPAGSMFWAKVDAIRPLFEANISLDDFAPEFGQTDKTLAHCLERLFLFVVKKQGYNYAIIH